MTKYDDATWHGGSGGIESGQIRIGLYLAWLAERDLLNPEVLDPASSTAIESRSISLGDLADVFDGKLVSAMLSPAGDQFTASFYRREYLAIWDRLEGASPDPATVDGWAAYDALVPAIDSRYRDWMASPRPSENQEWPAEPQPDQSPRNDQISAQVNAPAGDIWRGHEDPDLERRLAKVTTAEHINSIVGVKDPRLRSALRRIVVQPQAPATSAYGLATTEAGGVMLTAVRVPGLDAETTKSAVRDTAFIERGTSWGQRTIAGHPIEWAEGRQFEIAVWLDNDGVAFLAAGERSSVASIVEQLLKPTPS
jgi:hypothetical protein